MSARATKAQLQKLRESVRRLAMAKQTHGAPQRATLIWDADEGIPIEEFEARVDALEHQYIGAAKGWPEWMQPDGDGDDLATGRFRWTASVVGRDGDGELVEVARIVTIPVADHVAGDVRNRHTYSAGAVIEPAEV